MIDLRLKFRNNYKIGELIARPQLIPDQPGVYGWWFKDLLPDKDCKGTIGHKGRRLMYIGIAPRRPSTRSRASRGTLRKRIMQHCKGPLRTSTLRRSLACLLASEQQYDVWKSENGKMNMSARDERALSDWIIRNAMVSWIVHPSPWLIENSALDSGAQLPLNIARSLHPHSRVLKKLRTAVRRHR